MAGHGCTVDPDRPFVFSIESSGLFCFPVKSEASGTAQLRSQLYTFLTAERLQAASRDGRLKSANRN